MLAILAAPLTRQNQRIEWLIFIAQGIIATKKRLVRLGAYLMEKRRHVLEDSAI